MCISSVCFSWFDHSMVLQTQWNRVCYFQTLDAVFPRDLFSDNCDAILQSLFVYLSVLSLLFKLVVLYVALGKSLVVTLPAEYSFSFMFFCSFSWRRTAMFDYGIPWRSLKGMRSLSICGIYLYTTLHLSNMCLIVNRKLGGQIKKKRKTNKQKKKKKTDIQ